MKFTALATIATSALTAYSAVIEANDKTLPGLLDKGIPTLLDIYASWCGHCKRLNPVLDELATKFEHAQDKIQIVKIDGDKNSKTAKKYKIEYFPTIKFVDSKGETTDVEGRSLEDLSEHITKNSKAKAKKVATEVSNVVELNDQNFEKQVKDKDALVAFTTTWCGHCKRLHPDWNKLSNIYSNDDHVIIGQADCTGEEAKQLMEKYEIQSFPTILFFPKGDLEPVVYNTGRSLDQLVEYVNEKAGLFRTETGGLNDKAGRVEKLDELAKKVSTDGVDKLKKAAKKAGEQGKLYVRYADKYAKDGQEYVDKEIKRLNKLIGGGKTSQQKLDELVTKLNVLSMFSASSEEEEQKSKEKEEL